MNQQCNFTLYRKSRLQGKFQPFAAVFEILKKAVVKLTIEVALVISAISLAFGLYSGISNLKRNNKNDAKSESAQLTTVIVKLENIGNDINEIKSDLRDVKDDIKDHSNRLVAVEQQVKVLNNTVFKKGNEENHED